MFSDLSFFASYNNQKCSRKWFRYGKSLAEEAAADMANEEQNGSSFFNFFNWMCNLDFRFVW